MEPRFQTCLDWSTGTASPAKADLQCSIGVTLTFMWQPEITGCSTEQLCCTHLTYNMFLRCIWTGSHFPKANPSVRKQSPSWDLSYITGNRHYWNISVEIKLDDDVSCLDETPMSGYSTLIATWPVPLIIRLARRTTSFFLQSHLYGRKEKIHSWQLYKKILHDGCWTQIYPEELSSSLIP